MLIVKYKILICFSYDKYMDLSNNKIMYQESDSIILDLETLNAQYKNLLIEYQQAVLNYVNYLKADAASQNYDANTQPMVSIQGSTYLGTSTITQNNSTTFQECQASCSNTSGCTGATFNGLDYTQPMCWLRGGDSNVVSGSPNDYAIIPEGKQLLMVVQNINQQLTAINNQLQAKTTAGQPLYGAESQQRNLQNSELISQFVQLVKEQKKLTESINEYQTLDQTQTQGSIMVTQNYYFFILLVCCVFVIVYILYKFLGNAQPATIINPLVQTGGKLSTNAYYVIFAMIALIFVINYSIHYLSIKM